MTGQIPPYGEFFRRERVGWHDEYASRHYVLKSDPAYTIRSDHASEHWYTFFHGSQASGPHRTFTDAMSHLLGPRQWRNFTRPMEFAWAATREHQGWLRVDAIRYLRPMVRHPNAAITRCIAAGIIVQGRGSDLGKLTAVSIDVRERKVRAS